MEPATTAASNCAAMAPRSPAWKDWRRTWSEINGRLPIRAETPPAKTGGDTDSGLGRRSGARSGQHSAQSARFRDRSERRQANVPEPVSRQSGDADLYPHDLSALPGRRTLPGRGPERARTARVSGARIGG